MPRRERPAQTGRSEHWLRVAVNERTHEIDELVKGQFGWPSSERIEWRSPLKSDDYAEYYDGEVFDAAWHRKPPSFAEPILAG